MKPTRYNASKLSMAAQATLCDNSDYPSPSEGDVLDALAPGEQVIDENDGGYNQEYVD